MDPVPVEFKRFVENIEKRQPYKKQDFLTLKDLTASANYFYEKAVACPRLAAVFAETATKIYYLKPNNGESEMTFRKALVIENQKNSEELRIALSKDDSDHLQIGRALGIYIFFGELFNHNFIIPDILKRHLDGLKARKNKSVIAKECFNVLKTFVKDKVIIIYKRDSQYSKSYEMKSIMKMIQKAELENNDDEPALSLKQSILNSKLFAENSPVLNGNSKPSVNLSSEIVLPTTYDKTASFISILEELTINNSQEIIQKIEANNDKLRFEDGTWQLYYVILIEKALSNCELAEAVVDVCTKLSRSSTDPWQTIKIEDCKKFIHNFLNQKLEKLLVRGNEQLAKHQLKSILNLIQKLLEHSLYSIGHVKAIIDVLIRCAETNKTLTPSILITLMVHIKANINTSKIKKIPEHDRKKVLEIINMKKEGKQDAIFKKNVKEIADYMEIEYEIEDVDNDDLINEPSISGQETETSGISQRHVVTTPTRVSPQKSDNFNLIETSTEYSNNAHKINPDSNNLINHEETKVKVCQEASCYSPVLPLRARIPMEMSNSFKYSSFINNLMLSDIQTKFNCVRAAKSMYGWNLMHLAANLFEKSIQDSDRLKKYVELGDGATNSPNSKSFKDILRTIAIEALGRELARELSFEECASHGSEKTAESTAKFISELYNIGWVTKEVLLRCIIQIASENFEETCRVKIFLALLMPIDLKVLKSFGDDTFIFYLQTIRMRANKAAGDENSSLFIELTNLLESITCLNNTLIKFKDVQRDTKLDLIPKTLSKMNIINLDECVNEIVAIGIKDIEELHYLAITFLRQATSNFVHVLSYATIASKLNISAHSKIGETQSFKALLAEHCQCRFDDIFKNQFVQEKPEEVKSIVAFMSELIKLEIIPLDLLPQLIEVLLQNDNSCSIAKCIEILMKAVGPLIDTRNKTFLNRYFQFFESIVCGNENSFRSKIYADLIELRKTWTLPQAEQVKPLNEQLQEQNESQIEIPKIKVELPTTSKTPPTTEVEFKTIKLDFDALEDSEEMDSIANQLKTYLTSRKLMKKFIETLLNRSTINHRQLSSINTLFKKLADVSAVTRTGEVITFKECLVQTHNVQFVKYNSKQMLAAGEENEVAALVLMAGEMYRQEMFSDEDLVTWLMLVHKHIRQVPLHHLTYLSLIIQPRIQSDGGTHIKIIAGIFESSIHNKTMDLCSSIKNDITELKDFINPAIN